MYSSSKCNVRGRDLASFVAEAQNLLDDEFELPSGWYMEWGGQFENLQAASKRLAVLVPLALLLIFVLLYSTFASSKLGGRQENSSSFCPLLLNGFRAQVAKGQTRRT